MGEKKTLFIDFVTLTSILFDTILWGRCHRDMISDKSTTEFSNPKLLDVLSGNMRIM